MPLAALLDRLDPAVSPDRLLDEVCERRALEREPVAAGEEADEVGRGVDGPAVDQLHKTKSRDAA